MQATARKSDPEIQRLVLKELEWDPRVDEAEVGVQVEDGLVTLTGRIRSYATKLAAAEAAHRVHGVLDIANDLVVEIPEHDRPTDTEIARAVRDALHWHAFVDDKQIRSTVADGWVTLEGEVGHWFQREDSARALRRLKGIRGVSNRIAVRAPRVAASRIRSSIEEALARQAESESKRIGIDVQDGVATLSGTVRSWPERSAAERAAGFAPGVLRVQNELQVNAYAQESDA